MLFLAGLAVLDATAGCGGADVTAPPAARASDHSTSERFAEGLLPAVPSGADVILFGAPAAIFADPVLSRLARAVIDEAGLAAFEARNHVDVESLQEVVFADYGEGSFLVLARGDFDGIDVISAVSLRMNSVDVSSVRPFLRRRGFLGSERYDVIVLAPDVVVVGRGNVGTQVAALLEYVETGRFPHGSTAALAGPDGRRLRQAASEAPFAVYLPEPLQFPEGSPSAVLFARERALVLSFSGVAESAVLLTAHLIGEFPETATSNVRALVGSIAESDLGAALGIGAALPSLRIQEEFSEIAIWLRIDAGSLGRGLRLLFGADMEQVLGEPVNNGVEVL